MSFGTYWYHNVRNVTLR